MAETGIDVVGYDKASAVFDTIGDNAKNALQQVRSAGDMAGNAFSRLGDVATRVNQAMELGRKALNFFRIAVTDTIKTALNFRKIGDPAIDAFKNLERNAQILRARLGDVLIPLAQGLMDAFNHVGGSVVDWINANRKLIATNLADWLRDIGTIAVTSVAAGVLQISRAWSGWMEIIGVVKLAVNSFFALAIEGVAVTAEAMATLIGLFDDDMKFALQRTADQALLLAGHFDQMGDEAVASVEEQIQKQNEFGQNKIHYFIRSSHCHLFFYLFTRLKYSVICRYLFEQIIEFQIVSI